MLRDYLTYIQLCIFRSSVRNVSANAATIVLVCVLFALTSYVRFLLSNVEPPTPDPVSYFGQVIVIFCVFNVLMYTALVYRRNQNRYRKVLSAFVGTRTLIDLAMIIVVLVTPPDEYLRIVLSSIVPIWRMCIVGFILKEALDVRLPTGILISVVIWFVSMVVASMTIGPPITPEDAGPISE